MARILILKSTDGHGNPMLLDARYRMPAAVTGEVTPAQALAGNYAKRRMPWRGLTINVESPAGTVRRGRGWETLMVYDYGEIAGSLGADGDPVDVYLGPYLHDAPMVFVVHQRRYGDWAKYDEDKCMLGWLSEAEARAAYLQQYDDDRFLGEVTAMPVDDFVKKVRQGGGGPLLLVAKAHVKAHARRLASGQVVHVAAHNTRAPSARSGESDVDTGDLFDALPDRARGKGVPGAAPVKHVSPVEAARHDLLHGETLALFFDPQQQHEKTIEQTKPVGESKPRAAAVDENSSINKEQQMDKVKSALMAQVHEVVGSPEITYSQARAEARNAVISSRKLDLFDSVREEGNRLYLMSPGAANMARTIGAAVASVGGGYSGMVMGMTKQQFLAAAEEKLAPLVEAHAKNVAFAAAQRSRSTNPSTAEATRADSAAAGHAAGRAYLTVPFSSKDSAKAAGAKWDGDARKWYWSGKHDEMPSDLRKFYSGPMAGFSS